MDPSLCTDGVHLDPRSIAAHVEIAASEARWPTRLLEGYELLTLVSNDLVPIVDGHSLTSVHFDVREAHQRPAESERRERIVAAVRQGELRTEAITAFGQGNGDLNDG